MKSARIKFHLTLGQLESYLDRNVCEQYSSIFLTCICQQGACVKKLSGRAKLEDSRATKQIVALLSAPLEKYNDIGTALKLPNYPRVMDHLDNGTNKVMAVVIIQSIMKNTTCISTADKVGLPFYLCSRYKWSLDKLYDFLILLG